MIQKLEKTKTQREENLVLPKEKVQNADLYKPLTCIY